VYKECREDIISSDYHNNLSLLTSPVETLQDINPFKPQSMLYIFLYLYLNIFSNVIYSCNGKAEVSSVIKCHMILQKSFYSYNDNDSFIIVI